MDELRQWLAAKGLVNPADVDTQAGSEVYRRASSIERYLAKVGVPRSQARELLGAILTGTTADYAGRHQPGVSVPVSEHRSLTCLYCEIDISVPLAGWLDPEDLGEQLSACCAAVTRIVEESGGLVGDVVGVGVLAYFGYPIAHEDDAVRAIGAALSILEALGAATESPWSDFAVRIGIATGDAVTGAVSGGTFTEYGAVVGAAPNLAARLQGLAEPNSVVVNDQTRLLAGSRYVFSELGVREFPGFAERVNSWQVIRRHTVQSRFSAHRAERLSALVGRQAELAKLDAFWRQARDGQSQVVLVCGEAGVGKSRLLNDAFDRARTNDGERIRIILQCAELQLNEALHPIVGYIEYAAQFGASDSFEMRLDKLEAFFGPDYEGREVAIPLIARMMSVPLGDRYDEQPLTPPEFRQKLFAFMCGWVRARASACPMLIEFEDIHWSDATTLEFIAMLAHTIRDLPVLLVLTCRPPAPETIADLDDLEKLDLAPLDAAAARQLVRDLGGDLGLTDTLGERIVVQTDGNPLFIEATIRYLHERATEKAGPGPLDGALPSTLLETLQSQLDRLGGDKRLAQFAAVLGRGFSQAVIAATWPFEPEALESGFERLLQGGLLETRPAAESDEYRFAHALIREAAYQSLLPQDRARLHRHIAERMEAEFPAFAEREPHVLAHHREKSGDAAAAVPYLIRAANQALARSAYVEAANHIADGLALLPRVESDSTRAGLEIELRIPNGAALVATHGYATSEVVNNYRQLLDTARMVASDLGQFHALLGLSRAAIVRADMSLSSALTGDFLAVAQRIGRPELQLTAELLCGITQLMCAELAAAEETLNRVIAAYDPVGHAGLAHRLGQDPGITAMFWAAQNAWLRGDGATASQLREQALALARKLDHPFTLTYMLVRIAGLDRLRGDITAMRLLAEEAIVLADTHAFPAFAAGARFWLADAEAASARDPQTLQRMAEEIAAHAPTDQRTNVSHLLACLAERALGFGNDAVAADALGQCAAEIDATGVRWCEAEMFRLRGQLLARQGTLEEARDSLARARGLAAQQGALALELRALLDAARLTPDIGQSFATDIDRLCARFPAGAADDGVLAARELLDSLRGRAG